MGESDKTVRLFDIYSLSSLVEFAAYTQGFRFEGLEYVKRTASYQVLDSFLIAARANQHLTSSRVEAR
jgi:hypothetical protein